MTLTTLLRSLARSPNKPQTCLNKRMHHSPPFGRTASDPVRGAYEILMIEQNWPAKRAIKVAIVDGR